MNKGKNIVYAINGDEMFSGELIEHKSGGVSVIKVNEKFTLVVDTKDVYTDSTKAYDVYNTLQAEKEAMNHEQ